MFLLIAKGNTCMNMKNTVKCRAYPKLHTGINNNWNKANKYGYCSLINFKSIMLKNYFYQSLPTRFRMITAVLRGKNTKNEIKNIFQFLCMTKIKVLD